MKAYRFPSDATDEGYEARLTRDAQTFLATYESLATELRATTRRATAEVRRGIERFALLEGLSFDEAETRLRLVGAATLHPELFSPEALAMIFGRRAA